MPRKKHRKAESPEQMTQRATTNGHTKRGEKTQAVQDALKAGINSPKAIADYLRQHGIEITPAHVSTIKGKLGRAGRVKRKQAAASPDHQAAPIPAKSPARNGAGLSPEDLVQLANLANKAGGFERLQAFLSALKGIR